MSTNWRAAATFALLLGWVPSSVGADPVTVTSGLVAGFPFDRQAGITLVGDGFALQLGSDDFFSNLRNCVPCLPNVPIGLSALWRPTGNNFARATVDGVHYEEVDIEVPTLGTFTTGTVTLTGTATARTVTLPFSFAAVIVGFPDSVSNVPVFTKSLIGTGIARAQFRQADHLWSLTDLPGKTFPLEYTFSSVSATPEPTTLMLTALGAGVVVARRRRREG